MPANNKHGLGRGLGALFGEEDFNLDIDALTADENGIKMLALEKLKPCAFQPRKSFEKEAIEELANSIKEKGVLQPVLVRKSADKYEIVAGERRFRAAALAGLKEIPVIEKDLKDNEVLEVALIENLVRKDLLPLEEARGLESLMNKFHYTQERLAQTVGKSRSNVTNILRLLTLPETVQKMLDDGRLSAGHARALVGRENAAALAEKVVREGLSVRQTEALASAPKTQKPAPKTPKIKDKDLTQLEKDLSQKLQIKVQISVAENGSGKVVLNYTQPAELEKIIEKLEQ